MSRYIHPTLEHIVEKSMVECICSSPVGHYVPKIANGSSRIRIALGRVFIQC